MDLGNGYTKLGHARVRMAVVERSGSRMNEDMAEGIIESGLQSFYEVGKALLEIRDKELYEKVRGVSNFETYCKERWGMTANYARRLITSSCTTENIKSMPTGIIMPSTERQVRPLASLPPDKQREVWSLNIPCNL